MTQPYSVSTTIGFLIAAVKMRDRVAGLPICADDRLGYEAGIAAAAGHDVPEGLRCHFGQGTDRRTGELTDLLFAFRARKVSASYINNTVIPMLCRKAGVPAADVRGNITSHRARSTIASHLYNAKEPMTLFELQAWLGHRSPQSTAFYAKISPKTLTRAYGDAGYFARNVRAIEVLIDRDAVATGAAANGEPWQHYDLGHRFCSYTFFEQCQHRMACAECDFRTPKDSAKGQPLEAKDNLQPMIASIPLTDDERAAVDDGQAASRPAPGTPRRRPDSVRGHPGADQHPSPGGTAANPRYRSSPEPAFAIRSVMLMPWTCAHPAARTWPPVLCGRPFLASMLATTVATSENSGAVLHAAGLPGATSEPTGPGMTLAPIPPPTTSSRENRGRSRNHGLSSRPRKHGPHWNDSSVSRSARAIRCSAKHSPPLPAAPSATKCCSASMKTRPGSPRST